MSQRLLFVFLFGMFFISPIFGQVKIFVAPNGNDGASGTIDRPLATVHQAIINIGKIKAEKIDIILRKGVYYPDSSIVLNGENIGGKKILITAYNKEKVIISAGKKLLVNWK